MSTTRNPEQPEGARRVGRKKVTSDLGRQMLNRERRRLAREQAFESHEMVMEYRRQQEQKEKALEKVSSPERQLGRAIDRGLVRRVAGVLAAEDLTFNMKAVPSDDARSSAWTDFVQIYVRYGMFTNADGTPNYRMIAANFRGLAYHEGGHIRWSIPFRMLVKLATGEDTNRLDHLSKAWNILEDQRMETAVVSDSPAKAKYLLPMVMQHNCADVEMLANNYPYIVWRKYLPAKLRREGRKAFLASHSSMTEALCTEMEAIIERYVRATDPVAMLDAVIDFDAIYKSKINYSLPYDESHRTQSRDLEDFNPNEALDIPIDPDFDEDEAENEDPDEEGQAQSQGQDDGGDGAGTGSPDEMATPPDTDDEITDEDLKEMLEDAEEERDADRQLDLDEQAMYEASREFGSTLPVYSPGVDTNTEMLLRANNLAYEVENAFHAATMDKAPAWVEQQDRGVLNVIRYATRQPGDREFYKQWIDDDQPGFNIAVSVLLDNSTSMKGSTEELAAAGYATKLVCERLEIPCTVTLWNTTAQLLWDHHDKAEYLPTIVATGGTNPREALEDLFCQGFNKSVHIVLILTDGAWSGQTLFADYAQAGRHFLVLSYDENQSTANMRADQIRNMGADTSLPITDLMMIPQALEEALADAVTMF